MIYDYNTLKWYTDKTRRQYEVSGNPFILHHYETNKIPSFQLVIDSTISTATYKLFTREDVEISNGSVTVENATNNAGTDYSRLIFLGATLSSQDDGFYYIEVDYDGNLIYSDIFCWETDVSEYLKITATTSNVIIGEFELNTAGYEYLVYLDVAVKRPTENEIEEEGVQKTYGDVPLFNSMNKTKDFLINGYLATYDFLSGLRILSTNGSVLIEYNGVSNDVYDIELPEKENTSGDEDIFIIGLKFKTKDYLQSKNAI